MAAVATRLRAVGLALAACLVLVAAPAAADLDLDAAKNAGWVGERNDGFVGVVASDAPASAATLVDSVNARRREVYASIAEKEGTTIVVVAARAGQKLIERAPPGQWVQDANGAWVKKK